MAVARTILLSLLSCLIAFGSRGTISPGARHVNVDCRSVGRNVAKRRANMRIIDMSSPGSRLREAWANTPIMIPGVFNALAARMAESHGFQACYLSGGALSAGWAGLPDVGLLTLTEF